MLRKTLLALIPALVIGAAAIAGNTTFFTAIGDLVFPISPPSRDGVTAGAIDNMVIGATTPRQGAIGSSSNNPAKVSYYLSYQFSNDQSQMLFGSGSTATYAYIVLPATPINNQQACIFSVPAVTTLYLYAYGKTILNGITAMTAATRYCYTYSLANTSWYRSQ